jgi:hypothetical protein
MVATSLLSVMSVAELAQLECTYGTRLDLPREIRARVDAYHDQRLGQAQPLLEGIRS